MSVLDAVMNIISDLLGFNNLPSETTNALVGGLRGFIEGIMRVIEWFKMLFEIIKE